MSLPSLITPGWYAAVCDHLPIIRGLSERVVELEAQRRSLLEQLHRQEDLLEAYRRADEADDRERIAAHAPQWAPEPPEDPS